MGLLHFVTGVTVLAVVHARGPTPAPAPGPASEGWVISGNATLLDATITPGRPNLNGSALSIQPTRRLQQSQATSCPCDYSTTCPNSKQVPGNSYATLTFSSLQYVGFIIASDVRPRCADVSLSWAVWLPCGLLSAACPGVAGVPSHPTFDAQAQTKDAAGRAAI